MRIQQDIELSLAVVRQDWLSVLTLHTCLTIETVIAHAIFTIQPTKPTLFTRVYQQEYLLSSDIVLKEIQFRQNLFSYLSLCKCNEYFGLL